MPKLTTTETFFEFSTHCRMATFADDPANPACRYHGNPQPCKLDTCPRLFRAKPKQVPVWRTDFTAYCLDHDLEYEALINDKEWMLAQEAKHPNLDVRMSLELARKWWRSNRPGEGWEHHKKGRKARILWRRVYANALNLRCNQAWKPRQKPQGIM